MKCGNCGNEFSAKFCPECGTPTQVESNKIKCGNCGKENDEKLKYCSECGTPVNGEYNNRDKDSYKDKNRRERDNGGDDDDDDEGGIFGSIGDIIGKIFGS
jgi:predicted amidophosphoribosyltransferase